MAITRTPYAARIRFEAPANAPEGTRTQTINRINPRITALNLNQVRLAFNGLRRSDQQFPNGLLTIFDELAEA